LLVKIDRISEVEVAMEAETIVTVLTDEIDTNKTTEEEIAMTEEVINLLFFCFTSIIYFLRRLLKKEYLFIN
jgi:hypothetical protein